MTLEEVKQFIEENKEKEEVKSYLNGFKTEPSLEVFKELVSKDSDFISFMDSEKDKHLSKGLETFKTNTVPSLLEEKIKELYPDEDPKDLELKKLQKQMDQMQKDTLRKDLTNLALKQANEKKLPAELVDFFVSDDEETTLANLENFEKVYKGSIENQLKAKLQGNGDIVPKGNPELEGSYGAKLAEKNKVDQVRDDNDYFK